MRSLCEARLRPRYVFRSSQRATIFKPAPTRPRWTHREPVLVLLQTAEREVDFSSGAQEVERQRRVDRVLPAIGFAQLRDHRFGLLHVEHRQRRAAVGTGATLLKSTGPPQFEQFTVWMLCRSSAIWAAVRDE